MVYHGGPIRLRLPELMEEHQLNYHGLYKRSGGRISRATAYRLKQSGGRMRRFDAPILEALCDLFGIGPSELFTRERE